MDKSKARKVDYKAPASANKESFLNWHERLTILLITHPLFLLNKFFVARSWKDKKKMTSHVDFKKTES